MGHCVRLLWQLNFKRTGLIILLKLKHDMTQHMVQKISTSISLLNSSPFISILSIRHNIFYRKPLILENSTNFNFNLKLNNRFNNVISICKSQKKTPPISQYPLYCIRCSNYICFFA